VKTHDLKAWYFMDISIINYGVYDNNDWYWWCAASEGVKTHDFKAWYYTDTLWHRPDLDKHKPSDAAMFQHKKWKVDKWTYADNNGFKGRRRRLLVGHPFIHAFMHSFIHSSIHPFIHSFIQSFSHSFHQV
jgi:hypothetical protein